MAISKTNTFFTVRFFFFIAVDDPQLCSLRLSCNCDVALARATNDIKARDAATGSGGGSGGGGGGGAAVVVGDASLVAESSRLSMGGRGEWLADRSAKGTPSLLLGNSSAFTTDIQR